MNDVETRREIEDALKRFTTTPVAALSLFEALGYKSQKRLALKPNSADNFVATFAQNRKLNPKHALLNDWQSVDFLFQLTDDKVRAASSGQQLLFNSKGKWDEKIIESYLFFAIELNRPNYTRTALAGITRAVNRLFDIPAMLLFRHGDTITLAVINRRLHKRDQAKDVLEKVTLIKDINFADPIRAHLEILNDFLLANLDTDFGVPNFVKLHEAWQKRLGTYALSNEFYREIADWYFWAHHQVEDGTIRLPQHCDTEQEQSLFLIRLLTRVIFSWFLVEKRLIPTDLFREHRLKTLLKDFHPNKDPNQPDTSPAYYRAILQNLFFGTLNMPLEQRSFREKKKAGERFDKNYGITNLWRYEASFRNSSDWLALAVRIPFLNGGLFDCLDDKLGKGHDNTILDGFSENENLGCHLPNDLFFGSERTVDLSRDYGEEDKRTARSKKAKVRGLIEILSRYKFTVEENTPLEEEIALDPELLGKVFENLLASYNEDTRTTARKALGAFYTPREIVSYMVDEALKSYLGTQVPRCKGALEDLFSNKATLKEIKPDTREALIAAIGRVKILDPACGSGAFPMGALHRLVDLLRKLDPDNDQWRDIQRLRAVAETEEAFKSGDHDSREHRLKEINDTFEFNSSDYGRKLYLIENSIYGVDIQPIATQIAKLRFFIALVVEQTVDPKAPNLGVLPLPNLETRLVAADTLIPIEKSERDLFSTELDRLRAELAAIRHQHFNARSPSAKREWRESDAAKRQEIADYLDREHTIPPESARKLAAWDPYDQNTFAPFFDSEWMFGLPVGKVTKRNPSTATITGKFKFVNQLPGQKELVATTSQGTDSGFDVVIGNPPYVRMEQIKHYKDTFRAIYDCFNPRADLYVYFFEAGIRLLRHGGVFSFITSNKWFRSGYGEKLRGWLANNARILALIDFGDAPVFTAIAYPSITILQRSTGAEGVDASFRALNWELGPPIETFSEVFARKSFVIPQKELSVDGWRLEAATNLRLLERIRRAGKPLEEHVNGRFYYGIKTGFNDAFVIDAAKRDELVAQDPHSADLIHPMLRGRDVKRWSVSWAGLYIIAFPYGFHTELKRYPAVLKHLKQFETQLRNRGQCTTSRGNKEEGQHHWLELDNNPKQSFFDEFTQAKIITGRFMNSPTFAYDDEGHFHNNANSFIAGGTRYLAAILNSWTAWWALRQVCTDLQNGYLQAHNANLSQIPIPSATSRQQACVERLVDHILVINRRLSDDATGLDTRNDSTRLDSTRLDETRRDETRRDETRLRA